MSVERQGDAVGGGEVPKRPNEQIGDLSSELDKGCCFYTSTLLSYMGQCDQYSIAGWKYIHPLADEPTITTTTEMESEANDGYVRNNEGREEGQGGCVWIAA